MCDADCRPLNVSLGTFAPDTYQVEVTGQVVDEPFGPVMTSFGISEGASAVPIPTLSPAALWLLLLAVAMAGTAALRRIHS